MSSQKTILVLMHICSYLNLHVTVMCKYKNLIYGLANQILA